MVKPYQLHTLAGHALKSTQQMTAHLIRVQSGFLPEKNIQQAQELTDMLQSVLSQMQSALQSPPRTNQPYVPLK